MVAFWKRFLWLLAVNAVINSELCVEVPLALPKLFLRGVKTTLFRPPSKYYNSHWPTNLEYFTNRRVWVSTLQKWNTRPYTLHLFRRLIRAKFNDEFSEKSDKGAENERSAKFNPQWTIFSKKKFWVSLSIKLKFSRQKWSNSCLNKIGDFRLPLWNPNIMPSNLGKN